VSHTRIDGILTLFLPSKTKPEVAPPLFLRYIPKNSRKFFPEIMGRPVKTRLSLTVENPLHNLTPQQRRFIDNMLKGQSQTVAARAAGYSFPASAACKLLGQANIQEGLRYLHKKYEKMRT
jgi:hypothetical protein